jgi:hypothetical protein
MLLLIIARKNMKINLENWNARKLLRLDCSQRNGKRNRSDSDPEMEKK